MKTEQTDSPDPTKNPRKDADADVQPGAAEAEPGATVDTGGYALSTQEQRFLDTVFKYHPPDADQIPKYQAVRDAARYFAEVITVNVPPCADRTVALRKIREAVMTANAAIALKGFV
jgi:hypothetical protein